MEAYIQEFLDHLTAEKGCSDNTVAAYRNDLTQFYGYISQPGQDFMGDALSSDGDGTESGSMHARTRPHGCRSRVTG